MSAHRTNTRTLQNTIVHKRKLQGASSYPEGNRETEKAPQELGVLYTRDGPRRKTHHTETVTFKMNAHHSHMIYKNNPNEERTNPRKAVHCISHFGAGVRGRGGHDELYRNTNFSKGRGLWWTDHMGRISGAIYYERKNISLNDPSKRPQTWPTAYI